MLTSGIKLLGLAGALWVASFTPFLGAIFLVPFADVVLGSFALMGASLLPLQRKGQIAAALLLWASASLAVDVQRLPEHFALGGGVFGPKVTVDRSLRLQRAEPLRLAGDFSPFLAGAGQPWFVAQEMNVGGMRASAGLSLANRAETVEPVDLIWARGYVPVLGSPGFPRLRMERTSTPRTTHIRVLAESAPGLVDAEFKRGYAVPPPDPGVRQDAFTRVALSVFHDNLLRAVLGLNEPASATRDLNRFFDLVLERAPIRGTEGPKLPLSVLRDEVMQTPTGESASSFLDQARKTRPDERGVIQVEGCSMTVEYREYGTAGTRTYAAVLRVPKGQAPVVLGRIAPGHAAFTHQCDVATGRMLTFSKFGDKEPGLRIAGYSREGRLEEIYFFTMPSALLDYRPVMKLRSVQRGASGSFRFQAYELVREESFRLLEFASKEP